MNKISIRQYATAEYNRQQYETVLSAVEREFNHAADGYLFTVTRVSSDYTMTLNDSVILVDASGGDITITLKPARECEQKRVTIKKIGGAGGNVVTVDADGSETIDGATTKSLASQYDSVELVSQGGAWWIV